MAGVVLCAFFVLGVLTGFSTTGRALMMRLSSLLGSIEKRFESPTSPARGAIAALGTAFDTLESRVGLGMPKAPAARRGIAAQGAGSIAMVERSDGFYALYADGELRGPISADAEGDLPVLSGGGVDGARGDDLVADAALLVRAEAGLSRLISEMRLGADGTAALYLERTHTAVLVDIADAAVEIPRAREVLRQWRGRDQMIAAIDMTNHGEAVVRLRGVDAAVFDRVLDPRLVTWTSTRGAGREVKGAVQR
jgi:hypothetical protein